MLSLLFSSPLLFFITLIGLIISITIHEFSHAFVADRLGDPTPRMQGRLTLDPRAHLDPIGTLALILVSFGWGKPVQFDPYNLKNPVTDAAMISLAGPASNLALAVLISILLRLNILPNELLMFSLAQVAAINIVLAIFNLVPIHPLDGGKILVALLPRSLAIEFDDFMHRFSLPILIALIFPWYQGMSPISLLISPVIRAVTGILIP